MGIAIIRFLSTLSIWPKVITLISSYCNFKITYILDLLLMCQKALKTWTLNILLLLLKNIFYLKNTFVPCFTADPSTWTDMLTKGWMWIVCAWPSTSKNQTLMTSSHESVVAYWQTHVNVHIHIHTHTHTTNTHSSHSHSHSRTVAKHLFDRTGLIDRLIGLVMILVY